MRDAAGKFKKGNKVGGGLKQPKELRVEVLEDIVELRKKGYGRILRQFKNMSQMPISTFKIMLDNKGLSIEDAAFMSFFKNMIENGDVARMKFYFATYGIPTDLKAITVQESNANAGDIDDQKRDVNEELSKEEQLEMIEKMKIIIASS